MAFADVIHLLPALPLLLSILLSSFSNTAPGMKVNLARISIIFASGVFYLQRLLCWVCLSLKLWHLEGLVQGLRQAPIWKLDPNSYFLSTVKWGWTQGPRCLPPKTATLYNKQLLYVLVKISELIHSDCKNVMLRCIKPVFFSFP